MYHQYLVACNHIFPNTSKLIFILSSDYVAIGFSGDGGIDKYLICVYLFPNLALLIV